MLLYKYAEVAQTVGPVDIVKADGSDYIYTVDDDAGAGYPHQITAWKLDKKNRSLTSIGDYDFAKPIRALCTDGTYVYVVGDSGVYVYVYALSFDGSNFTLIDTYTIDMTAHSIGRASPKSAMCVGGEIIFPIYTGGPTTTILYAFSFDGMTLSKDATKDLSAVRSYISACLAGSYYLMASSNSTTSYIETYLYSAGTITRKSQQTYSYIRSLITGSPSFLNGYVCLYCQSDIFTNLKILYMTMSSLGILGAVSDLDYTIYTQATDSGGNFITDGEFLYMKSGGYIYVYNPFPSFSLLALDSCDSVYNLPVADSRFIICAGVKSLSPSSSLLCYTFGRSAPGASCLVRYTESI